MKMNRTVIWGLLVLAAASACWGGSPETADPEQVTDTDSAVPTPTVTVLWQPPELPRDTPPTPKPIRTPEPTVVIVVPAVTKSVAFNAEIDLPAEFVESGEAVVAQMSGWVSSGSDFLMFMTVEMDHPVSRSVEILLSNSFDVYMRDLTTGRWYLLPENLDSDLVGPLEEIVMPVLMSTADFGADFGAVLDPVEGGYRWTITDDSKREMSATYDTEYQMVLFSLTDPTGTTRSGCRCLGTTSSTRFRRLPSVRSCRCCQRTTGTLHNERNLPFPIETPKANGTRIRVPFLQP